MPTALMEPETQSPPAALIEEARQRQRQRRALVAFLVLLGGAVAALGVVGGEGSGSRPNADSQLARFTTSREPRVHTATSTLYISANATDIDPRPGAVVLSERGIDRLIVTFRGVIESRRVVAEAIANTQVRRKTPAVLRNLETRRPPFTNLIEVSVTDRDARTAGVLANAVADAFAREINAVAPGAGVDPRTGPLVHFYERAKETP